MHAGWPPGPWPLFRYIDGWYNPNRIQKALGWRSPDEYEADYYRNLEATTAAGTK